MRRIDVTLFDEGGEDRMVVRRYKCKDVWFEHDHLFLLGPDGHTLLAGFVPGRWLDFEEVQSQEEVGDAPQ